MRAITSPDTPKLIKIKVSISANAINIFVKIFCSSSGFRAIAIFDKPNKNPRDRVEKANGLLLSPIIRHLLLLISTMKSLL